MAIFKGAGVAIVTPMTADGEVNYEVLGEMLEAQIAGGTDAIIICGTTGESATLSEEEHSAVIRYAIKKVNKRIPVIAGTGSNCTATAIKLSKEAATATVRASPVSPICWAAALWYSVSAIWREEDEATRNESPRGL